MHFHWHRRDDEELRVEKKIELDLDEIVRLLKAQAGQGRPVVRLILLQLGEKMFTNNIIGLTPGQLSKFQIVPLDVNGNPDALVPGTTLTYTSSDPVNAPAVADPSDPSGLTMDVNSSAALASPVTLTVVASAQKDGTSPSTGPVTVAVLQLAVKSLGLNQLQ